MKIRSGMVFLEILAKPANKEKNCNVRKANLVVSIVYYQNLKDLCTMVFKLLQLFIGALLSGHSVFTINKKILKRLLYGYQN